MSLSQLEALWLEQPVRKLFIYNPNWRRSLGKLLSRTRRNAVVTISSQYYLTSALRDSRRALRLNEDITLASLLIAVVLAFSVSNILTSALYQATSSANGLSDVLGANVIFVVTLALGGLFVAILWLVAFLQNLIAICLMEGATRKKKRSLVLTLRQSLRNASRTALAWIGLFGAIILPIGLVLIVSVAAIFLLSLTPTASLVVIVSSLITSLLWLSYILTTYSLIPYLMLFNVKLTWSQSLTECRRLVHSKGRWFLAISYLFLGAALALTYEFSQFVVQVVDCNSIALFSLVSIFVLFIHNACLTMLYRKRRLARKW